MLFLCGRGVLFTRYGVEVVFHKFGPYFIERANKLGNAYVVMISNVRENDFCNFYRLQTIVLYAVFIILSPFPGLTLDFENVENSHPITFLVGKNTCPRRNRFATYFTTFCVPRLIVFG